MNRTLSFVSDNCNRQENSTELVICVRLRVWDTMCHVQHSGPSATVSMETYAMTRSWTH